MALAPESEGKKEDSLAVVVEGNLGLGKKSYFSCKGAFSRLAAFPSFHYSLLSFSSHASDVHEVWRLFQDVEALLYQLCLVFYCNTENITNESGFTRLLPLALVSPSWISGYVVRTPFDEVKQGSAGNAEEMEMLAYCLSSP